MPIWAASCATWVACRRPWAASKITFICWSDCAQPINCPEVLKEIKASSSKWVHQELKKPLFSWQEGYGAFTVGASQRQTIKDYIARQEEHHGRKTFQEEYLEFLQAYGVEYNEKYLW